MAPTRSLQSRIVALFVLLMLAVQLVAFFLIDSAGVLVARKTVGADVIAGARVFERQLTQETQRLVQGARLLSSDYAFREAVAGAVPGIGVNARVALSTTLRPEFGPLDSIA